MKVTIVKKNVLVDGKTLEPAEARRAARKLMDAAAGAEGGPCKLEVGQIDDALYVMVFLHHDVFVAGLDDMDYATFDSYFPDCKHAMGYHYEDDGAYFAFWVEDCFCPPVYIIKARSFEHAYETFCDTFTDVIKIEASDLKDYDQDTLNYSGDGVPIETEAVMGREVGVLSVGWKLPAKSV